MPSAEVAPADTEGNRPTTPGAHILVWGLTLVCVAAIGAIAGLFVLMATSLDPLQIINAGAEPWLDAAKWLGAFAGSLVAALVGLRCWHSARFRPVALLLLAAQAVFAAWAYWRVYTDYF